MSESTFHTTRQDIRKPESKVSRSHDGKTPADSDVSKMKVNYHCHTTFKSQTANMLL